MKSKKTKIKAALLALFVAMLCVLGAGCGGGPSIVFDERFDSNKSFLEFYKIFKKQNDDNVILSLDFDTDSRFECLITILFLPRLILTTLNREIYTITNT